MQLLPVLLMTALVGIQAFRSFGNNWKSGPLSGAILAPKQSPRTTTTLRSPVGHFNSKPMDDNKLKSVDDDDDCDDDKYDDINCGFDHDEDYIDYDDDDDDDGPKVETPEI